MQPVTVTVASAIPDGPDDHLRVHLPPRAAAKLVALRDAADAAGAVRQQAVDQRVALREEIARLRLQLREHEAGGGQGSREAQGQRDAIERRQAEMGRLQTLADKRGAEMARANELLRRTY